MNPFDEIRAHLPSWRRALLIAQKHAEARPPDIDDKAYWQHEIDALDRIAERPQAWWNKKIAKFLSLPERVFGPMAMRAMERPPNFDALSPEQQWDVDKRLGILDWDGDATT